MSLLPTCTSAARYKGCTGPISTYAVRAASLRGNIRLACCLGESLFFLLDTKSHPSWPSFLMVRRRALYFPRSHRTTSNLGTETPHRPGLTTRRTMMSRLCPPVPILTTMMLPRYTCPRTMRSSSTLVSRTVRVILALLWITTHWLEAFGGDVNLPAVNYNVLTYIRPGPSGREDS